MAGGGEHDSIQIVQGQERAQMKRMPEVGVMEQWRRTREREVQEKEAG